MVEYLHDTEEAEVRFLSGALLPKGETADV